MDRETVIRGLECCCTHIVGMSCGNCPYEIEQREDDGISDCTSALAYDALAMLKEQEAVEPKTEPSANGFWFTCGACGWWLFEVRDTVHFDDRQRIRYCASCGQAVKWE